MKVIFTHYERNTETSVTENMPVVPRVGDTVFLSEERPMHVRAVYWSKENDEWEAECHLAERPAYG